MTALASSLELNTADFKQRRAVSGERLGVLAGIYEEENNIAIWQRELSEEVQKSAEMILEAKPGFQVSTSLGPETAYEMLNDALGKESTFTALVTDMAELVEMFCCLFELKNVGLRLTALNRAMCPRFHVDRVPCRLITTYLGEATQWLPHDQVNRSKLGPGSQGMTDDQSGLYSKKSEIQQLEVGEVALLKGESWIGNEEAGLVHRSPSLKSGDSRLLLTLDFTNS